MHPILLRPNISAMLKPPHSTASALIFKLLRPRRCYSKGPLNSPAPYRQSKPSPQIRSKPSEQPPLLLQQQKLRQEQQRQQQQSQSESEASDSSPPLSFFRRVLRQFFRPRTVIALVPLVPILFLATEHIGQIIRVNGQSMTPYLNEDYATLGNTSQDVIFVNRMNPAEGLRRGMIVTFPSPANPSKTAIKRIIALPGDRVTTRPPHPNPTQIVPWNHVWVEGDADDTRLSLDSNTYGPISMSLIFGRVEWVLWPRMRRLRWEDWEREGGEEEEYGKGEKRKGWRQRLRVEKGAVRVKEPYHS